MAKRLKSYEIIIKTQSENDRFILVKNVESYQRALEIAREVIAPEKTRRCILTQISNDYCF